MKVKLFIILSLCLCVSAVNSFSQKRATRPDSEITKMVREVSAKNIEADIRKLVSFGTRNTLSSQDDPNRGVGAARDWIYSEFERISKECGGCLIVEKQTFTTPANPPPRGRFPESTVLTNVYAV